jgi:hypothetical protein
LGQPLWPQHSDPQSRHGQHLRIVGSIPHGSNSIRSQRFDEGSLLGRFIAWRQAMEADTQNGSRGRTPPPRISRQKMYLQLGRQGHQPFGNAGQDLPIESQSAIQVQHQVL